MLFCDHKIYLDSSSSYVKQLSVLEHLGIVVGFVVLHLALY